MGYALGIIFIVLLLIGLPIGLALGLGSLLSMGMYSPVPLEIVVQRLISGIRSFPLLAIPLYIIAGSLMNASGITQRLVDFAYAILGGIRGGSPTSRSSRRRSSAASRGRRWLIPRASDGS